MILLTTSRRPSRQTRLIAREFSRVLPGARYLPRGTKSIWFLFSLALRFGLRSILVVENREGRPGLLRFMMPVGGGLWRELEVEFTGFRLWKGRTPVSPTHIEPAAGGEEMARELSAFLSLPVESRPGEPAVFVGRGEIFIWDGREKVGPEFVVSGWRVVL